MNHVNHVGLLIIAAVFMTIGLFFAHTVTKLNNLILRRHG